MIREFIRKLRKQYIENEVRRISFPDFPPDRVCRYQVTFSGRVQNVGFRFEAWQIAKQLDLTGYCENLSSGDVLAEFQGQENKILFLIETMESIRRIVIENKIIREIPLVENDSGFGYR